MNIDLYDESVPRCTDKNASQHADVRDALPFVAALRRYFRRRAAPHEVDDLVQEVYLSLLARRADNAIEDVGRYVFVVAGNLLRRRARKQPLLLAAAPDDLETPTEITPEQIAIGRQNLERVETTIQSLPARTRQVFVMHRYEEKTYPSIAQELGISVSAVEKHIIAALRSLRAALEDPK